jgi:hypothetical protein
MYVTTQSRLGSPWRQYQEQVVARDGKGGYTILLRPDPAALSGLRRGGLRGLGAGTAQIISAGAGVATKVATPSIVAATGASGLAAGALTAGIGAGVAVLVAVLASLWSAHEARAKGATTENAAVNSAVQAFDGSLKAIFAAANAGTISAAQAGQYCQQTFQNFWQYQAPYMTGPGRADSSGGGSSCGNGTLNSGGPCTGTPGGHLCNLACTASCCVGCQDLYPTILQALSVFNSPTGGMITACTVYGSKYGAIQRGSYSLTYTPPAATSAAGVLNSLAASSPAALSSIATAVETSTVAGIPLWLLLAGGVGAYFAMR